jgi:hypothetical protein
MKVRNEDAYKIGVPDTNDNVELTIAATVSEIQSDA